MRGVQANVELDLRERSSRIRAFAASADSNGSRIKIVAADGVRQVDAKECVADGRSASCIDVYFNENAKV
ncbi:MAG: hypothetical protein AAGL49_05340, partial [Pseudomonadota bacterium]